MAKSERHRKAEIELRVKILDAAREVFVADGYDAVTMRKVATKINCSPTAIYLYFKDKGDLIRELCRNDFSDLAASFLSISLIEDPVERLRKAGQVYFDFVALNPEQYRLMFMTRRPETVPEGGESGDPAVSAYAFLRHTLHEAIDKRLLRPGLKDPDLVSQVVWAATHGMASLEVIFGEQRGWVDWRSLSERQSTLIEFLLRAILRRSKPVPAEDGHRSPSRKSVAPKRFVRPRRVRRG